MPICITRCEGRQMPAYLGLKRVWEVIKGRNEMDMVSVQVQSVQKSSVSEPSFRPRTVSADLLGAYVVGELFLAAGRG